MNIIKELIFVWTIVCCSAEMAKLFNAGNSISATTSSTLAWSALTLGEEMPVNAVPIGKGGPIWCRNSQNGIPIAGAVIDGSCHVPFVSKVKISDNFQVLISINGSARLSNVQWDSLMAYPSNTVSTPNMLLALNTDAEHGVVLPGYVDPRERRAYFLHGNKSLKLTGGFLVTEDEPYAYELSDVRLDPKAKKTLHDEVLQEFIMENPTDSFANVSKEITFKSPQKTYYGKMKGTIMGLPAFVHGPDAHSVNITWGIDNDLHKNRTHVVSYGLPAGTKVGVKLIAVIRVVDGGYGGKLTSFYRGDHKTHRRVGGLNMERSLAKLRAEFTRVKYIVDDHPVDDVYPRSVILLHSSTTTTTSSPNEQIAESTENVLLPQPQPVGVNDANSGWASCLTLWSFLLLSYFLK